MRSTVLVALLLATASVGTTMTALRIPEVLRRSEAVSHAAHGHSEGAFAIAKARKREPRAANTAEVSPDPNVMLQLPGVDMLLEKAIPKIVKFLLSKGFAFTVDTFAQSLPSSSKRVLKKTFSALTKTGAIATLQTISMNAGGLAYSLTRLMGDIADVVALIQRVSFTNRVVSKGAAVCERVARKNYIRRILRESVEGERDRELFSLNKTAFVEAQTAKASLGAAPPTLEYLTEEKRAKFEGELANITRQIREAIGDTGKTSIIGKLVEYMDKARTAVENWKNAILTKLKLSTKADQITNSELKSKTLASISERAERETDLRFRWDRTETQVIIFAKVTIEENGALGPPGVTMAHMAPSWRSDDPSQVLWPRGIRLLTSADSFKCSIRNHTALWNNKQPVSLADATEEEEQYCRQDMAMVLNPLVGGIWSDSFLKRDSVIGLPEPTFMRSVQHFFTRKSRGFLTTVVPDFPLYGSVQSLLRGLAAGDAPTTPPKPRSDPAEPLEPPPEYCVSVYGQLQDEPKSKGEATRKKLKGRSFPTQDPLLLAFDSVYTPGPGNTHARVCTDNYAQAIVLFCTASNIALSSPTLANRADWARSFSLDHGRAFIVHSPDGFDPSLPLHEQLDHGSYYKHVNSLPKYGPHVVGVLCSSAATEYSDAYSSHVRLGIDMSKTDFVNFTPEHFLTELDVEIQTIVTGKIVRKDPTDATLDGSRKLFRAALAMVAEEHVRTSILQGAREAMANASSASTDASGDSAKSGGSGNSEEATQARPKAGPRPEAACEQLYRDMMSDGLDADIVAEDVPDDDDSEMEGDDEERMADCALLATLSDERIAQLRAELQPAPQRKRAFFGLIQKTEEGPELMCRSPEGKVTSFGKFTTVERGVTTMNPTLAYQEVVRTAPKKPEPQPASNEPVWVANPVFEARERELKEAFIKACANMSAKGVALALEIRNADSSDMLTTDDLKRFGSEDVAKEGELAGEVIDIQPPTEIKQRGWVGFRRYTGRHACARCSLLRRA